ncbi:hypothetical protein HDU97_002214 [Phlyctochytrium planicorne]|nr:hypothetical protein HDU97_002214 [Phlyctochytrium planicorne]
MNSGTSVPTSSSLSLERPASSTRSTSPSEPAATTPEPSATSQRRPSDSGDNHGLHPPPSGDNLTAPMATIFPVSLSLSLPRRSLSGEHANAAAPASPTDRPAFVAPDIPLPSRKTHEAERRGSLAGVLVGEELKEGVSKGGEGKLGGEVSVDSVTEVESRRTSDDIPYQADLHHDSHHEHASQHPEIHQLAQHPETHHDDIPKVTSNAEKHIESHTDSTSKVIKTTTTTSTTTTSIINEPHRIQEQKTEIEKLHPDVEIASRHNVKHDSEGSQTAHIQEHALKIDPETSPVPSASIPASVSSHQPKKSSKKYFFFPSPSTKAESISNESLVSSPSVNPSEQSISGAHSTHSHTKTGKPKSRSSSQGWNPIPLFRSNSAPNIDLILDERDETKSNLDPAEPSKPEHHAKHRLSTTDLLDIGHLTSPVAPPKSGVSSSSSASRKSLDVIAAQHLGVTEDELPKVLAEEGISRWAAIKATTVKAASVHHGESGRVKTGAASQHGSSAGVETHRYTHSQKVTRVKKKRTTTTVTTRHREMGQGEEGGSGIVSRSSSVASLASIREHAPVDMRSGERSFGGTSSVGSRVRATRRGHGDISEESEGSLSDTENPKMEFGDRRRRRTRSARRAREGSDSRHGSVASKRSVTSSSGSSGSSVGASPKMVAGEVGAVSSDDDGAVQMRDFKATVQMLNGRNDGEVGGMGGDVTTVRRSLSSSGLRRKESKKGSVSPKLAKMVEEGEPFDGGEKGGDGHTVVVVDDEDDMAVKKDFLIKLSRTFALYGAPSHRLEYHLTLVSKTLEVEADYIVFPGMIMISFGGESSRSNTHIVKTPQGFNMGKLAQVNALCLTLTHGLLDIYDAIDLLEAVKADQDYPWYIILATFPVTSFTLCILGFGGNWLDACIAAVLGLLVGVLSLLSERCESITYLLEFFASLGTAFICRTLQWVLTFHGICFNYIPIVLSSIAILLPGLSLTISIIELSTRNMVSGTVRLFSALFTAMLLGFGMTIGGALVFWNDLPSSGKNGSGSCGEPQSPFWAFLLFWPMSISTNIFFQANVHQWPIMIVSAASGWIVSVLLNLVPTFKANSSATTAIASLVIGLVSNIHSRVTHDVAVAPVLAGILLQVPGSLGVRSSLSFFISSSDTSQSIVDGVQFTFQMLTIGMSLALGLFVATFLVFPLRGPKAANPWLQSKVLVPLTLLGLGTGAFYEFKTPSNKVAKSTLDRLPEHAASVDKIVPVLDAQKWSFWQLSLRFCWISALFLPVIITFPFYYLFGGRRILMVGSTSPSTSLPPIASHWWFYLLAETLERAGPLWIKLAQWSSSRSDVLPDSVCRVLGRLQSHVRPHAFVHTKSVLESHTDIGGQKFIELFAELEEEPIGVGAISQVYKGRLKDENDTVVAVKILHPHVKDTIYLDTLILRKFASAVTFLFPSLQYLAVKEELENFTRMMSHQLDLRVEGGNLTRFRKNFAAENLPITFPKPISALTRENVLVETYHDGLPLSSFLQVNPTVYDESLSMIGIKAFLKMCFRHNFTHADLHPGNALVSFYLPDSKSKEIKNILDKNKVDSLRMSLAQSKEQFRNSLQDLFVRGYKPFIIALDVGIVSELSPQNAMNLTDVFGAAIDGDSDTVANLLMSRCRNPDGVIDQDGVRAKMKQLLKDVSPDMKKQKILPLSQLHSAQVVYRAADLFRTHRIQLDGDWVSLFVASALVEGIGRKLNADMDVFDVVANELR